MSPGNKNKKIISIQKKKQNWLESFEFSNKKKKNFGDKCNQNMILK